MVNIFDFYKDIYGEYVEVEFHDRIRDEIKFSSPEKLVKQLKKDQIAVAEVLKNHT